MTVAPDYFFLDAFGESEAADQRSGGSEYGDQRAGRQLFLYPVDLVSQLGRMVPEQLGQLDTSLLARDGLGSHLRTVRFSNGDVRLRADDGRVTVEECRFDGDWVNRMTFSGSVELTGERKLDLVSRLSVSRRADGAADPRDGVRTGGGAERDPLPAPRRSCCARSAS